MAGAHPQLTWGQVKGWAEANGVPDDAQMFLRQGSPGDPHYRVRDLDMYPADEDGGAHFIVSSVWG